MHHAHHALRLVYGIRVEDAVVIVDNNIVDLEHAWVIVKHVVAEEMNNYKNLCWVEMCSLHYPDFQIFKHFLQRRPI